jgi:hypothetical protein
VPDSAILGRGQPGARRGAPAAANSLLAGGARKSDSVERATAFAVGHAGSWQLEDSHGAGPGPRVGACVF